MIEVLPGILAENADELREKLFFPGFWEPGVTAHVDILDGTMFGATCFCDATTAQQHFNIPHHNTAVAQHFPSIELHCMVQNPLPIIEQWKSLVPETIRAIIHAEIDRPLAPILHRIQNLALETGIALCPQTVPDVLRALPVQPDRLLIMGVEPGASGRTFLGEPILAHIRRARSLYPILTIAVDGGMNAETAQSALHAGANAYIATSAIWSKPDPRRAYQQLAHNDSLPHAHNI